MELSITQAVAEVLRSADMALTLAEILARAPATAGGYCQARGNDPQRIRQPAPGCQPGRQAGALRLVAT